MNQVVHCNLLCEIFKLKITHFSSMRLRLELNLLLQLTIKFINILIIVVPNNTFFLVPNVLPNNT